MSSCLGRHIPDVSAEAFCAEFHKPTPRRSTHVPLLVRAAGAGGGLDGSAWCAASLVIV